MLLSEGQKLGPYQILAPLGEGGMGEVWKARDTRLDRTVAVKVSKAAFTERFEREARAVAALNHPNICTLHDVGPNYLVMELVEGTPLKGPLPLEKAVEYGGQILDALDAAHRKGITHRDLKPANILVTKQGIKLLDFGLAKQQTGPLQESDDTVSGPGQIVGTLQYMSPEQLQSQPVDARSDIFAFGSVLYEMLSGKRAFDGGSAASVIAAILEREPVPLAVTPPLDRVIRKCLAKDPDERFQTARDLKYNLGLAMEGQITAASSRRIRWPWVAAATVVMGICAFGGWTLSRFRHAPASEQVIRLQLIPPEGGRFNPGNGFAVSPDGRTVAFVATSPGKTGLWVRSLDGKAARFLPGTEGSVYPYWSPDNRSIAFTSGGKIMRVDAAGGAPVAICDSANLGYGTWTADGQIIFATGDTGLHRVPASGGTPEPLTTLDASRGETAHRQPQQIQGGRIMFWVQATNTQNTGLYTTSLANPQERIRLVATSKRGVFAGGHVLWLRGSTLVAQRYDPDRLQMSGEAEPVVEPVGEGATGTYLAAVANGILVFSGRIGSLEQFTWVDRAGKPAGTFAPPLDPGSFRIAPDGTRVAVTRQAGSGRDLWMADVARDSWSRFTFMPGFNQSPVWSPDGLQVLFSSSGNLYRKDANGAGTEQRFTESQNVQIPMDWSRDGRSILLSELAQDKQLDLWVLPVTADGKPEATKARPYLGTRFTETNARFSPEPNPRWVAYQSNESGRDEIYVQAFPEPRAKWPVSTRGGRFPEWSKDGQEMYYLSPESKVMAVSMNLSVNAAQPSTPRELFPVAVTVFSDFLSPFALAADGKKFLVRVPVDSGSQPLEVIVNWPALLKK